MDYSRRDELNRIRESMGLKPIEFTQPKEEEPPTTPKPLTRREASEPMISTEDVKVLEAWWRLPEVEEPAEIEGGEEAGV